MSTVHLILVGLTGSGKSTIGRRLADVLGREFVDTDQLIESGSGRTIRQIFDTDGEDTFRDLESSTLADVLASSTPLVVATGGGIVIRDENRRLMHGHDVIWLRASLDTLVGRLGNSRSRRPLLDGDLRRRLVELDDQRRDLYRDVASSVMDVDGLDLDRIVTDLQAAVGTT